MAEALAHGADVNCANDEDEGKTPLMQAVVGVRRSADEWSAPLRVQKTFSA